MKYILQLNWVLHSIERLPFEVLQDCGNFNRFSPGHVDSIDTVSLVINTDNEVHGGQRKRTRSKFISLWEPAALLRKTCQPTLDGMAGMVV